MLNTNLAQNNLLLLEILLGLQIKNPERKELLVTLVYLIIKITLEMITFSKEK